MVLYPQLFVTTRIFSWVMEVITWDIKISSNPFFWGIVIKKSRGTTSYDTIIPWLNIWYSIRGIISAAFKTYVDDLSFIVEIQSLST